MEHAIDLHVHSTHSDGTSTPSELVAMAKKIGLTALALTDHDSVSGISTMRNLCLTHGIQFVPGIELSTAYQLPGSNKEIEVHILGYYIDENDKRFNSYLSSYIVSRDKRNEQMVALLQENGLSITIADLKKLYPDSTITRAHLARYLYDTNQVKSMNEAFNKYLGDGAKCYVSRKKVSSKDAIALIHDAKGIAVLAHPPLYNLSLKDQEAMVSALSSYGLDGIEAVYSTYHNGQEAEMKRLAKEYQLIITGGSDFHGTNKPYIHLGSGRGNLYVHDSIYYDMKQYYQERH